MKKEIKLGMQVFVFYLIGNQNRIKDENRDFRTGCTNKTQLPSKLVGFHEVKK